MEWWKRIRWVGLYGVFYMMAFYFIEHRQVKFNIIYTTFDSQIPFCEYFIIPYLLWFFYVAATVFYFAFINKNEKEYYRFICNLGLGMTIFIFISWIYPNGQMLRPTLSGENIFEQAVMALYKTDTPTNIFPSIHVFNSVTCCIAFLKNEACRRRKGISCGIILLTVLIVLSTMMLKQHSVIDVIGAFVMSAVLYPIVYPCRQREYSEESRTERVRNRRIRRV